MSSHDAGRAADLHLRAAAVVQEPPAWVAHLLAAGLPDAAAELIEQIGRTVLFRAARLQALALLIARLDLEPPARPPWLALLAARAVVVAPIGRAHRHRPARRRRWRGLRCRQHRLRGQLHCCASELESLTAAELAVASDLLLSTGLVPIGLAAFRRRTVFGVDGRVARRHLSHPVPQPIFGGPR